jgi:hypothetical protein
MRSAGNFHPEWGYLAPTPSFVRTLRIALVATAIGATAGAGVVVSLVARPASGGTADSLIAAHALVTGVPAANPASAAAVQAAAVVPPPAAAGVQQAAPPGGAGTSIANAASAPNAANGAAPAEIAHVEEPAAAEPHEDTALLPEAAPSKKTATKKHRVAGYETIRRWQASREAKRPRHAEGRFEPLFRLFSSRNGSLFSAN